MEENTVQQEQLPSQNMSTYNPDEPDSQADRSLTSLEVFFNDGTYSSCANQLLSDIASATESSYASVEAMPDSTYKRDDAAAFYGLHSTLLPDLWPPPPVLCPPAFLDCLHSNSGPFQLPLHRMGTSTPLPCRGSWTSEGGSYGRAMSAEKKEAVAIITADPTEESSRDRQPYEKHFPKPETGAGQLCQGRVDMSQQVLYDFKGGAQMLDVNNSNQDQMNTLHTVRQNHKLTSPEQHYQTPPLTDTEANDPAGSGKEAVHPVTSAPVRKNISAAVQTTCQNIPQPCVTAPGLPIFRPALHTRPCLISPPPLISDYGYNTLSSSYFPQFHQTPCHLHPDAAGFISDRCIQGQSEMSLSGFAGTIWDSKSKKPCNCTKSQCLKLYCDCFANGDICNNCNCINCCNDTEHEAERFKAIKTCLDRNPEAFRPKIGSGKLGGIKGRHTKGCNCKRSGCLKNYCECYEAKIMCSSTCKCLGCKNYEESPRRKMKVSANTSLIKTSPCQKNRYPLSCITLGVVKATCSCLLAQAEEAEKESYSLHQAEKMILQEYGQCLTQIVQSIWKSGTLYP
ncbi:spexin prohormone 2 isoform X2 [Amia ocellicauda]|uniref:spexin prohormone 2 isoform X2 n=1 Tax=Amia ocellicauda TaxID=2972642 RepID=UPI003463A053